MHHAGAAYIIRDTMAALYITSRIEWSDSPCVAKARYIDCLAMITLFTCASKLRCSDIKTPRIFSCPTLVKPGVALGTSFPIPLPGSQLTFLGSLHGPVSDCATQPMSRRVLFRIPTGRCWQMILGRYNHPYILL